MFTGIIQEVGILKKRIKTGGKYQLEVRAETVLPPLTRGESIAVNGVCLTAVNFSSETFMADVMPETLRKTNLEDLKIGSGVNLELPVKANDFLGGHIVSGHVDGTGRVKKTTPENNALVIEIAVDPTLTRYMIEKGSITLNGVSLTIVDVTDSSVTVSLIPETRGSTNLNNIRPGEEINIETDIFARYTAKMIGSEGSNSQNSRLTKNFLVENGFI